MQTILRLVSELSAGCRIRLTDNSLVTVLRVVACPNIKSYALKLSGFTTEHLVSEKARLRVVVEKELPKPAIQSFPVRLALRELPPMVSFKVKVCMDPKVHLPSTWRMGKGKPLTNRMIAEYQREGKYGSELKLPPIHPDAVCAIKGCNCKLGLRKANPLISWVPVQGAIYCKNHWAIFRTDKDKEKSREKELQERISDTRKSQKAEVMSRMLEEYC